MTFSFGSYTSNPQSYSKPSEEKIAKMKEDQEARRSGLRAEMDEYREIYAAAEESYAQARSIFEQQQQELARHEETDRDYDKYEEEFRHAKKAYQSANSDKDLKLQLLQYRTDNYVRASRLNLLDFA